MTDKVAIFIDGGSTYAAAKSLNIDIDYKCLPAAICPKAKVVRAAYYTVAVERPDEFRPMQSLLDFLSYNGFIVTAREVREYEGGRRERGSIAVDLALDALELSAHVDHVFILTGDLDFLPLIEGIQRRGRRVTIVSTVNACADELRRQADTFIDLVDIKGIISRDLSTRKEPVPA